MFDITIQPQEESTDSQFDSQLYTTANFIETFGEEGSLIAATALEKIKTERVPTGADYLQVCNYAGITFWLIDDNDHVTALMPEDY